MSSRAPISDPVALAEHVKSGDRRSLARALTFVENMAPGSDTFLDEIFPEVGRAWRIGLTGPPGAGKSTLAGRLIERFIAQGRSVAYLGVDPSSPFSGGAVLGDRIRVDLDSDHRFFMRSAASRGAHGGLSLQSDAIADVLEAAGFDIVLIESIGAGQAEIDIARIVDTVVVVLVPESGDEIQAMKAGLLEIGDILCVNKADRASADRLVATLQHAIGMRRDQGIVDSADWPRVTRSVATASDGVGDVVNCISDHVGHLKDSGAWSRLRDDRLRRRIEVIVRTRWEASFWTKTRTELLHTAVTTLDTSARRPYLLASRIIEAGGSSGA